MSRKLFSLIRASMTEGMQIFTYRSKDNKSQKVLPIVLVGVMFLAIFGSVDSLIKDLAESGTQYTVLALFVLATTALTTVEGIYKSSSLLFKCRDNDLLLSMPIKKSTITFIRIFKFYVFELMYNSIFLIPAILAYMLNVEIQPSYFLVAVVMLLLLPVIPVALSCVIGAATSAIAARFWRNSLLQVILSLLFMAVVAVAVFFLYSTSGIDSSWAVGVSDSIAKIYYPAEAFVRLATDFNIWELLLFIVINLAVFAVTIAVVARFYYQIVTKANVVRQKTNKDFRPEYKQRSQTAAMVKKEFTRYFHKPVLIINTAMGLVLFVIAVIVLCLNFDSIAASIVQDELFPITYEQIYSYMPSVTFAMVAFTSLLTYITATSFSLEGKAFNILKTLPIDGRKVMLVKVLSAILLTSPVILIGSLIMFFRFQFGLLDLLLVMLAAIVMPLVTELIGVFIDLKYPRFNAENDAEVVKQSPAVMVASFLGLGLTIVTISLTSILVFVMGQTLGLAIVTALYTVIFLILFWIIQNYGEQKYLELSA